ncbi:MAG: GDP-L-fucose synthase family protein [Bacteroidota bacterium]
MEFNSPVFAAGHRGMVGGAIHRCLQSRGYNNIITASRAVLDLRNSLHVDAFFESMRPAYVFLAAAKVGGIHSNNTYPADFLYDNLMIQSNVIEASRKYGVTKLLFLGSSCIYPRMAPQPIREDSLLTGPLEQTNEAYAVAKIAGIRMCQAYHRQHGCNFISAMPTNMYGYGDNYHPENSHVIPGLIRRIHEARVSGASEVVIWGTGTPLREFMFADDLASACVYLMENYNDPTLINIGTGEEYSIRQLAELIAETIGFTGRLIFDPSRPDGTPRKLMDSSRLHDLGFRHQVSLREGLRLAYSDFVQHHQQPAS